jgi:hypothetical protein
VRLAPSTGREGMTSNAETLLAVQLEQAGIPFEREFRFAPEEWCRASGFLTPVRQLPKAWRADFLVRWGGFPAKAPMLVEVDGGGYVQGRHGRGKGMEDDAEKQSAAAILGYRVIRCTPAQVDDGRALDWIRQALGLEVAA